MQEHRSHLECSLRDILYYPVEDTWFGDVWEFDIADQETSEGLF